jgi:hypothetical protein
MPNLFTPRADLILRSIALGVVLTAIAGTATLFAVGNPHIEPTVGFASPQPVMFSHEHHVGRLGLDCRYCHVSAAESDFAGMPTAETCMGCHAQLYDTAPMLEPVRAAWRTGEPVRWNRVYRVADVVHFDHRVHVHAGVSCASCHGRLDEQPLTRLESPLSMGWCLDCHRSPEGRLVAASSVYDPAAVPEKAAGAKSIDRKELLTNCSACHY